MKTKRIDLELNESLPVSFDLTLGALKVISTDETAFIQVDYIPIGNDEPKAEINISDTKNEISLKNCEVNETRVILNIPQVIKELSIELSKGNIIAENISGKLDILLTDGDIKVENSEGILKLNSMNGQVFVKDFNGELNLISANGESKISNWQCKGGNIDTNNGKLLIELNKVEKEMLIKNKNGRIIIGVADGLNCEIIGRGKDVINYIEKSEGDHLGSPAKIICGLGGPRVTLFSRLEKVQVCKINDIERICPNFDKWFQELDQALASDFKKMEKELKKLGNKLGQFGKTFMQNIKKTLDESKSNKSNINKKENLGTQSNDNSGTKSSGEKMEILKMLKEGTITPEQAEKLLNALKD